MKVERRQFLRFAAGSVAVGAMPRFAGADTFPSRPIRLVLPFPPGGVFDIIGRPWADKVSRTLGTVIVENSPAPAVRLRQQPSRTPRPTATRSSSAARRCISPT